MNQNKTTASRIGASMREMTYLKVMFLLEQNPDLTQRELAQQLGVSVGSVNYCLKSLMEKGWLKMKNFIHSKNKFGYIYVLTPKGIAERTELTSNFLVRKLLEYQNLKHEIELLQIEVNKNKSKKIVNNISI